MNTEVMFSSRREDWATPQWIFDELDREFHFTLDAAADAQNAKCARFWDEETDALAQEWGGTKQSGATRHIVEKQVFLSKKRAKATQRWLCFFLPERIRDGSMSGYWARLKYGLYADG